MSSKPFYTRPWRLRFIAETARQKPDMSRPEDRSGLACVPEPRAQCKPGACGGGSPPPNGPGSGTLAAFCYLTPAMFKRLQSPRASSPHASQRAAWVLLAFVGCGSAPDLGAVDDTQPSVFPASVDSSLPGPLVLAHGFGASTALVTRFFRVKEALEADGHHVLLAEVEPFQSVEARAQTLGTQIDKAIEEFCVAKGSALPDCKTRTRVHIVAHSMGGLDARHAISSLGYASKVASLTTIGTPHRGTRVADIALEAENAGGLQRAALEALASAFGRAISSEELARDPNLRAATEALSESRAEAFEQLHPDMPGVYYASWAGLASVVGGWRMPTERQRLREACGGHLEGNAAFSAQMLPLLLPSATLIAADGTQDQDGLVSLDSAKHGHFQGCVPADHMQEVGQPLRLLADPFTGFDHIAFYRGIARDLSRRVN